MPRHDRRVGYGLPLLLAIGLHLAILVLSVLRFPEDEVEPPSTNIVQATLVSTETTTDQAQRATAAESRIAEFPFGHRRRLGLHPFIVPCRTETDQGPRSQAAET